MIDAATLGQADPTGGGLSAIQQGGAIAVLVLWNLAQSYVIKRLWDSKEAAVARLDALHDAVRKEVVGVLDGTNKAQHESALATDRLAGKIEKCPQRPGHPSTPTGGAAA